MVGVVEVMVWEAVGRQWRQLEKVLHMQELKVSI
jgi:hypothetical protein